FRDASGHDLQNFRSVKFLGRNQDAERRDRHAATRHTYRSRLTDGNGRGLTARRSTRGLRRGLAISSTAKAINDSATGTEAVLAGKPVLFRGLGCFEIGGPQRAPTPRKNQ